MCEVKSKMCEVKSKMCEVNSKMCEHWNVQSSKEKIKELVQCISWHCQSMCLTRFSPSMYLRFLLDTHFHRTDHGCSNAKNSDHHCHYQHNGQVLHHKGVTLSLSQSSSLCSNISLRTDTRLSLKYTILNSRTQDRMQPWLYASSLPLLLPS